MSDIRSSGDRYAEADSIGKLWLVKSLDLFHLHQYSFGVFQKFSALFSGKNALGASLENGYANLVFNFLYSLAEVGLTHKKIGGSLGNGAYTLHLDHIFQMLEIHPTIPFRPSQ